MSIQGMKSDIRPLCDRHLIEMEAVDVKAKMGGTDVWTLPAFRCAGAGCTRMFDSGGYVDISDGSINPESRNFIGCEDGAMFIENVEGDLLIWRCCTVGCERSGTTDEAFHPISDGFLRRMGAIQGGPSRPFVA
jgi:hypothetical protein